MSTIENKYQIGVRRFSINWVGLYSLYCKETLRFLSVFGQTIVGPIITAILFLIVISLAIGDERADVLGVKFITFLAPGLIAMQLISQSFAHSSSSILMAKVMGNIVDLVGAPLSAAEVTISVIFASITRSVIICLLSILVFSLLIDIKIQNYSILILYVIFWHLHVFVRCFRRPTQVVQVCFADRPGWAEMYLYDFRKSTFSIFAN